MALHETAQVGRQCRTYRFKLNSGEASAPSPAHRLPVKVDVSAMTRCTLTGCYMALAAEVHRMETLKSGGTVTAKIKKLESITYLRSSNNYNSSDKKALSKKKLKFLIFFNYCFFYLWHADLLFLSLKNLNLLYCMHAMCV